MLGYIFQLNLPTFHGLLIRFCTRMYAYRAKNFGTDVCKVNEKSERKGVLRVNASKGYAKWEDG